MINDNWMNKSCKEGKCADCTQSILNCNGKFELWIKNKKTFNVQTFTPYFDVSMGKEVSSKRQIKEYCKKNNMVYASDKELTQQCEQNKKENEQRYYSNFENGLKAKLMECMQ